ncbi:MAG: aspartyl protease family protein [Spirochaetes bacterium]|nr:aspartyl protease family protein [Spirochaetota bacterium]
MLKLEPGKQYSAFTLISPSPPHEVQTPVKIRVPLMYPTMPHGWLATNALWDTGATHSVVNADFAKALNLVPISRARTFGIGGGQEVDVYTIDILLMDSVLFENWRVSSGETGAPGTTPPGIIIGMDIITKGDATMMSDQPGHHYFSFILPSTKSPRDFREEIRLADLENKNKQRDKLTRAEYNAGLRRRKKKK